MEYLPSTLLATLIVLGVLIFVHELGHFIVAKLFGVGVDIFSLGFGPRLIGRKYGGTDYRVSAVPLGGYVKMVGESLTDEVTEEEKRRSFSHKNVWKRIAIVFAGPFSNILFTVVVFFLIFLFTGLPSLTSHIGKVQEDYPAAAAGLREGDLVTSVNGNTVRKWDELSQAVRNSGGNPVTLTVERNNEVLTLTVTPRMSRTTNIFGEDMEVPMIGIGASSNQFVERLSIPQAAWQGTVQTWNIVRLTVLTVVKLIERKVSVKTVGGPIMIAQMAGQQAREGIMNLVFLMAFISVNLAIINLLPIPVLDGGHLLFFGLEVILRRPVSLKKRELAQQIGMYLLIALMLLIIYNDLARLVVQ